MADINTFLSRLAPAASTSSIEEKKVPDTHRIDPISGVEIPVFAYEKCFGYDGDGTEDFAVEKDKYGRIIEIEGLTLTQGQIETQTFFDLETGFEDTPFRPLNSEKVANFIKYMGSSEEEKKEAADIAQAREDATNPFLSRFHKDVAYNPPESVIVDEPKKEEAVAPKEKKTRKKKEEVQEVLTIPLSAAVSAAQPEEKTEDRAPGRLVVYMRCMPVTAPESGIVVQIGELIHAFYLQIGSHYSAVKFGEGKGLLYNAIEKSIDALLVQYNEVHLVVPICEELSILQSILDSRAHAKIVAF